MKIIEAFSQLLLREVGGAFRWWWVGGVPIFFCVDVSFNAEKQELLEDKPDTWKGAVHASPFFKKRQSLGGGWSAFRQFQHISNYSAHL